MNLFHNKIQFNDHDPLDDGLADAIRAEQEEPEAFETLDDYDGDKLAVSWAKIAKDAESDQWFAYKDD